MSNAITDEIVTLLSGSLKFIGTDPEIVERLAGLTKLLGALVEAAVQGQPPYLVATEVLAGLAVASFVESVAAPAILAEIIVTGLEDIGLVAVSTSTVTASTTAVTADTAITAVAAYIIENRADALTSITADVQSDPYDAQAIKAIVALAPALFQGSGGPNSTSVPQAPSTVGFSTVQNTLFLVFGNLGLPTGSQVVSYLPDGSSITLSYTSQTAPARQLPKRLNQHMELPNS